MQPGALYLPLGGAASLTGDGTSAVLAVDLGDLRLPGEAQSIFDARAATLAVYNATDQAIVANGLELVFRDPAVPGAVVTYTATNAAIAAGTSGTALVPLASGVLSHVAVSATFAAAPASGGVAHLRVAIAGPGAPAVSLTGSYATQTLVDDTSIAALGTSNTIGAAGSVAALGKLVNSVAVTCSAAYNASATAGVTVDLYASPNGTTWDTDAFATFAPDFVAGATKQKTVLVDVGPVKAISIVVSNGDGTYATGQVTVTWEQV